MGELAPDKILVIVIVAFLLFGAKRLPEVGASLGQGIREFKRTLSDSPDEPNPPFEETPPEAPTHRVLPPAAPVTGWKPKRLSDRP